MTEPATSCLFLYPPSDGDALAPDEAEGKSLLDESEGKAGAIVRVGLELSILLLGVTEPILL